MTLASPSQMNSLTPLRIGIIGLGKIGKIHLSHLQAIPGVSIVAIAETAPIAEELEGVRYTSDYNEVVSARDIDAVVITLPHELHADPTSKALLQGKHVFLEKPIAISYDEAKCLVQCAEDCGRTLMVNMTHRFYPPLLKARELLTEGAIGDIVSVRDFYMEVINRAEFPAWFFDPQAAGGGVAMTDAIHLIDRVEWLLDEPLQTLGVHGRRIDEEIDVEDCVEFLCATASNIPVTIGSFFCFDGPKTFSDGLTIFGTKGSLSIHAWSHVTWTPYGEEPQRFEGYAAGLGVLQRSCVGHRAAIAEFVSALRENRPPASEAKAVLNAQKIVQDFYNIHPSKSFYNVAGKF